MAKCNTQSNQGSPFVDLHGKIAVLNHWMLFILNFVGSYYFFLGSVFSRAGSRDDCYFDYYFYSCGLLLPITHIQAHV
jgi:hypothetical protein